MPDFGQIGDDGFFVLIKDFGSHGHAQHNRIAILAGALTPHAGLTVFREKVLLVAEIDQCVQAFDRLNHNVTTPAAIAPIGTAVLHVFFTPKRDATAASCTGANVDFGEIEKLHELRPMRVRCRYLRAG